MPEINGVIMQMWERTKSPDKKKKKGKQLIFNVTGQMQLADEVKGRRDKGQTELRKLSLEQHLSLTQVDQNCIAKPIRKAAGIIKGYKRKG